MPQRETQVELGKVIQELGGIYHAMRLNPTAEFVSSRLQNLREVLGVLTYYSVQVPQQEISAPPRELVYHVKCSHEGCTRTSTDPDACILNFGGAGNPPRWLCREHHLKSESGITLPGYQKSQAEKDQLAAARAAVLEKLTPEERNLINSRIVR